MVVAVGDEVVDLGWCFGMPTEIHRKHAPRFTAAKGSMEEAVIKQEHVSGFAFQRLGGEIALVHAPKVFRIA